MKQTLSNQPVKGSSDWMPEECAIRRYIFDVWRNANCLFGYEEYLTPIFEHADIYRAKSGEDVGGKELMVITDRGGRELAIRPEMTPSVTRMVSKFYQQVSKPLRLFSIANFWRNEKPQRGRNREFWQLNTDIFGNESIHGDLEILQLALQIMLSFHPPKGSFTLYLNHRQLIDTILRDIAEAPEHLKLPTVRILDKFTKLPLETFQNALMDIGLSKNAIAHLTRLMQSANDDQLLDHFPALEKDNGFCQIRQLFSLLQDMGYGEWIAFNPSIIRGFDYYDGMVFEIFDHHPDNNRSMFGGGRYNGLANLFGKQNIPAVGFAPGDETTRLFLKNWDLIPGHLIENQNVFFPLIDQNLFAEIYRISMELREAGIMIEQGIDIQTLKQALTYANKKKFSHIIILGSDEMNQGIIGLRNMQSGEQVNHSKTSLVEALSKSRKHL